MTTHPAVLSWIEEVKTLCQPDAVHWCDGSQQEYDTLCELLVQRGAFTSSLSDFETRFLS